MGWQQTLTALVASLAWPVAVVVAVVVMRRHIGALIGRITKVSVGPATVSIGAVEEAAQEILTPPAVNSEAIQQFAAAESIQPEVLDQFVREQLRVPEEERRAEVEQLVRNAMDAGWDLSQAGLYKPTASLIWSESGKPTLVIDDINSPRRVKAALNWYRLKAMQGDADAAYARLLERATGTSGSDTASKPRSEGGESK
jgi:hypothetical protein